MIIDSLPWSYPVAAMVGTVWSLLTLILAAVALTDGSRGKSVLLTRSGVLIACACLAAWGFVSWSGFNTSFEEQAVAHFGDYGLHLDADDAEHIRNAQGQDLTIYLETSDGLAEVLFREVDGAVNALTLNGNGRWIPLERTN